MDQHHYFVRQQQALRELAPALQFERAAERYEALLDGRLSAADQACAFLPPALFIRELKRRLSRQETTYSFVL